MSPLKNRISSIITITHVSSALSGGSSAPLTSVTPSPIAFVVRAIIIIILAILPAASPVSPTALTLLTLPPITIRTTIELLIPLCLQHICILQRLLILLNHSIDRQPTNRGPEHCQQRTRRMFIPARCLLCLLCRPTTNQSPHRTPSQALLTLRKYPFDLVFQPITMRFLSHLIDVCRPSPAPPIPTRTAPRSMIRATPSRHSLWSSRARPVRIRVIVLIAI